MHLEKIIENIKGIRPWLSLSFIIVIFLGIAYFDNFRSDTIHDPDSFYHIRHSWIYKEMGVSYSDFPWVQYSVIKEAKADLWYGFHIFLIPLTYFEDLTLGIKIAGFFTTFFVLSSFYFALRNLGVYLPALWSSVFIFSSPMVLSRMAMTRPHPLSLGIFVLIFSFLIKGPAWLIFVLGFITTWIHSSLFWFPFIIFAVIFIFKKINRQESGFDKLFALLAGTAGGLFARPHPIANLRLIYIQIVELYLSKKEVLEQIIGGELLPPGWTEVRNNFLLLAIIFVVSLVLLAILFYKKESMPLNLRIASLSSLILACISIPMYMNANRAIDMLAAFAVIFIGIIIGYYLSKINDDKSSILNKTSSALLIIIFALIIFTAYESIKISNGNLPSRKLRTAFQEPSLWLKNNTKQGEIVFYPIWSYFPILFFWNQHNYYINGMDPVFLYAYDKSLYWKLFYIYIKDMGSLTCGSITCGPEQIEPVYDVLVRDFKASYVFTRKLANPRFGEYLESDKKHFEKVYEEGLTVIYKVLPPESPKTTKKTTK